MKIIIAGSRAITGSHKGYDIVACAVEASGWASEITEVVCGCCHGVDRIGWDWARMNLRPVSYWPAWLSQANWAREMKRAAKDDRCKLYWEEETAVNAVIHGRAAGMIRNRRMAEYADRLILVTTGSPGSASMLREMTWLGKPAHVETV